MSGILIYSTSILLPLPYFHSKDASHLIVLLALYTVVQTVVQDERQVKILKAQAAEEAGK